MRKASAVLAALGAMALLQPAAAAEWSTSYGRMTLPDNPQPGPLRADYSSDAGRIIGTLLQPKCLGCGLVFEGIWVEAGSAQECASEQDGSRHWGSVSFEFNPEFTAFGGKWDYCGAGGTYNWRGSTGVDRMMLEFR